MKLLFCNIFIVVTLCRADAVISYNPTDWPAFTLKLSAEGTLKDVYDSGLRPWLAPGSERSFLSFKHARVTVQTHEGVMLPEFPVEYADIYCTRDGRLHHIDMTSPPLPFANARALILPWFPMIGKNEIQLDAFFEIVKNDQIGYQDPDFGKAPDGFHGGWVDAGKTDYGIGFRNNKNPNLPFRTFFAIGWHARRSVLDRRMVHVEPIKPPPGYENESMIPPQRWGPDSTLEKMRALDLDTGEPPAEVAEQRRNGERPPLKTGVSPPSPAGAGSNSPDPFAKPILIEEQSSKDLLIWPWMALGALVLTIWAVIKRRS